MTSVHPLLDKIRDREARIGIIGMGYVGLPLAVEFAAQGFKVTGFDLSADKVLKLSQGISYIPDVPTERVASLVHDGFLEADTSFNRLSGVDVVIICVPTPFTKAKQPDLTYVIQAANDVQKHLSKGMLVILESTTYPGTTREVVAPILERSGLTAGKDFYLTFSPERVDPGNRRFSVHNTPKIVGGINEESTAVSEALYSTITSKVVPVSCPEAAEMAKLLENTFRHVNIALANEMAFLCDSLGIDIWEVIDAAATKPFGFMPFYPGPGVGGHCIPIDPFYFSWKVREFDHQARFIELAGEINDGMPDRVVARTQDALNDHRKSIRGSKILALGVAYKRDIDDMRESPALKVMLKLVKKGADLHYHDPYIPNFRYEGLSMESRELDDELIRESDCILILTDHSCLPYEKIVESGKLVIDTRNALRNYRAANIVKL